MTELTNAFSRRQFLAATSCLGAFHTVAHVLETFLPLPLPALAVNLAVDSRISPTPLVDKGFASVRKIGNGLYATISDTSKGFQTTCNGGFLAGKDAALLIEGFSSAPGASFQFDALRMVTQVPIKGALDTITMTIPWEIAFYGANGVPLWAHEAAAKRIVDAYAPLQGVAKEKALARYEKRVQDAKSDLERAPCGSDLNAMTGVFAMANASVLSLPNHPLDPAKLPLSIDLGGLTAILEHHPGHSGTDIIVRVPEQNVVYTGDLLFNGLYPVCFDSQATVSGWRTTLKKFAAFDKDTLFVPGHGQLCGQEAIASIRGVFDDIAAQAETMYKAGVPVEEAQHRYVVPEKYKTLFIWSWGFSIGAAITILYAEWKASS